MVINGVFCSCEENKLVENFGSDYINYQNGVRRRLLIELTTNGPSMTTIDHLLLLAFAVLYPAYAFYAYRRIKPDLVANKPGIRVHDYRETIGWLWLFAIAVLAAWVYQDRSWPDLGLGMPLDWPAWVGLLVVAIVAGFMFLQLRKLAKNEEQRQELTEQLSDAPVSEFLPRTKNDMKWFVLLSVTAGITEEILFRGFLIWYFQQIGGIVLAVIFSSILFGLAHSYQGIQGGIRTGFIGLILALGYIFSGSLLPVIFFHIAGDIYSGRLGRLAFGGQDSAGD